MGKNKIKAYGYAMNYSLEKEIYLFTKWYRKCIVETDLACNEYYKDIDNVFSTITKIVTLLLNSNESNLYLVLGKLSEEEMEIFKNPSMASRHYLNEEAIKVDFKDKKVLSDYITLNYEGKIVRTNVPKYKDLNIRDIMGDLSRKDYIKFDGLIAGYELKRELKNLLFNIIAYCLIIMENEKCAHKALDFSITHSLDIDIPVVYGIKLDDENLREFINKYLDHGGDEELLCFTNYCNDNEIKPLAYTKLKCIIDYIDRKEVSL